MLSQSLQLLVAMRLDPSDSFVPSHPQEGDSYESTNVSKPVNDSGPTMDEPVDIDTKTLL